MNISEHSRIWIYQADRELSAVEVEKIQTKLDEFTAMWLAHGEQLAAKAEIRHHRFIILSVDEAIAGATGCSIDKSVKLMQQLENEFQISLFDRFQVAYRDGEEIKACGKPEFQHLINTGTVNAGTIVFNNLVKTRQQLASHWETPLKESWHNQVFSTR